MAQSTAILGAGIIGVATAYYLSETSPASSIHLIEPSPELFASASGFAAGFLAADWFSPPVAALGKLSFEEHKRLADEYGGREKWGYSRSTGLSYTAGKRRGGPRGDDWLRHGASRADAIVGSSEFTDGAAQRLRPEWLARADGDDVEVISEEGSTAQVWVSAASSSPPESSHKKCLERGVQLHHPSRAVSTDKDVRDELSSLRIINTETNAVTDIPCQKILISAGAWSPHVFSTLFPDSRTKLPISSLAGHSLVVRSPQWSMEHEEKGCHAIFISEGGGYSPEVFSRIGGEIYIAGLNDPSLDLPELATESKIDGDAVERLMKTVHNILGTHEKPGDMAVIRKGLCFRPVTKSGTPILAQVPDERLGNLTTRTAGEGGVWLAAGHGPWGISLSLGLERSCRR
ncbi:putative oxidoreductase [Lachnellula suecica]|uniref:Putative oxidoreductase n=1 Tax=Lachnellula suecica TaxID=602035 RepID=A0A8T9BYT2_9HELO|nr:putative oxidoreductase [Lachnellula suecica]